MTIDLEHKNGTSVDIQSIPRQVLAWGKAQLAAAGIENPGQEAEFLLADLLGREIIDLYLGHGLISHHTAARYQQLIRKRSQRYPLQYLISEVFFRGHHLNVREGVFIPRPETELLVETAIGLMQQTGKRGYWAWDLCCGTGNIAVSLAKEMPDCKVIATDISPLALETAAKNVAEHNLQARIMLSQGDLFSAGGGGDNRFAAIISNPPYIEEKTLKDLPPELRFEPPEALCGGWDGLSYYRRIIGQAASFLEKGGFLVMEMGEGQGKAIASLFSQHPEYSPATIISDYNNRQRIIYSRKV